MARIVDAQDKLGVVLGDVEEAWPHGVKDSSSDSSSGSSRESDSE